MKLTVHRDVVEILDVDTPEEVLRVKRLPYRYFSEGSWFVPINPETLKAFQLDFGAEGVAIAAVVEEREAELFRQLQAPAVTPELLDTLPAVEALEIAQRQNEKLKSWRR